MEPQQESSLDVAFFAANAMGVRILEYVLQLPYRITYVATCKDDFPQHETRICELCAEHGIPVLKHANPNSAAFVDQHIRDRDLLILAWWPNIIKPVAVAGPKVGWVNMHPSLLPIGRGKHGYYWSIVEHRPFGVTLHLIDDGIDTGPILFQKEIPVSFTDTGETLYSRSQDAMFELFTGSYPKLCSGDFTAVPQESERATFRWGKEIGPHSKIDLERSYRAEELIDILRGKTFLKGDSARCEKNGKQYRLKLLIEPVEDDHT